MYVSFTMLSRVTVVFRSMSRYRHSVPYTAPTRTGDIAYIRQLHARVCLLYMSNTRTVYISCICHLHARCISLIYVNYTRGVCLLYVSTTRTLYVSGTTSSSLRYGSFVFPATYFVSVPITPLSLSMYNKFRSNTISQNVDQCGTRAYSFSHFTLTYLGQLIHLVRDHVTSVDIHCHLVSDCVYCT